MPAPRPKYRLENTACRGRHADVWQSWAALLRGSRAVHEDILHPFNAPQGLPALRLACCTAVTQATTAAITGHASSLQALCWHVALPSANRHCAWHTRCVLAAACKPHLCRRFEARRGDSGAVDGACCPRAAKSHAVQQLHRQDHPGVASQRQQGIAGQPAAQKCRSQSYDLVWSDWTTESGQVTLQGS